MSKRRGSRDKTTLEVDDDERRVLGYLLTEATSGWGEPLKDIEADGKFQLDFGKADAALKRLVRKLGAAQ